MQFKAEAKFIRFSPDKMRFLAALVRGKSVKQALNALAAYPMQRSVPLRKMIESAAANARYLANIEPEKLAIKEIRVDQGPIMRYFKPGAMGRASLQRRRMSHMKVVVESVEKKEA